MTPVGAPDPPSRPTIASIQGLRALAASMVLAFHACAIADAQGVYAISYSNAGAAGVDIFFVISGFIIAYITRRGPVSARDFLARRLIRIAPAYWVYTTLTLAILLAVPSAFAHLRLDLTHVAMSYAFLLSNNNDNVVGTLLGVGWTICFEVYFYVLAALLLNVPQRHRMPALAGVLIAGAVLAPWIEAPPFAAVVLSALPLEFLAGFLIAILYLKGVRLPAAAAVAAIALGGAALYAAGQAGLVASERDPWRVLCFGLPAAVLVIGVLSLDARSIRYPRALIVLGDASYSLYLSHQFVLYAVGGLWKHLGLATRLPAVALLLVMGASAILFAVLTYQWCEKPMTRALNGWWGGASAPRSSALAAGP